MQTFLPYDDADHSAACLDRQRQGKQRLEVLQILRTLNGESQGWRDHPAVQMWDGYTEALIEYGCAVCDHWTARGYTDNLRQRIVSYSWGGNVVLPPWWGNRRFHYSHRSNLVRKLPQHYRRFFPRIRDNIPYVWPVTTN